MSLARKYLLEERLALFRVLSSFPEDGSEGPQRFYGMHEPRWQPGADVLFAMAASVPLNFLRHVSEFDATASWAQQRATVKANTAVGPFRPRPYSSRQADSVSFLGKGSSLAQVVRVVPGVTSLTFSGLSAGTGAQNPAPLQIPASLPGSGGVQHAAWARKPCSRFLPRMDPNTAGAVRVSRAKSLLAVRRPRSIRVLPVRNATRGCPLGSAARAWISPEFHLPWCGRNPLGAEPCLHGKKGFVHALDAGRSAVSVLLERIGDNPEHADARRAFGKSATRADFFCWFLPV